MVEVAIRDVLREDLGLGVGLLASTLGFAERDAIPAWLALTTWEAGGVALGAYHDRRLVGFSYAVPALEPGGPHLFSCGLAVVPELRSLGIGRRLKLVQRNRALARGLTRIRWTADPLSAAALGLYLSRLGARLVGYRAGMYSGLRDGARDDVEIEWSLEAGERTPLPVSERVEIPLYRDALTVRDREAARRDVRRRMTLLLRAGLVGVAVEADRAAGRCSVAFAPEACA
jgi:predicted GNAT superfamily acetyltransferase